MKKPLMENLTFCAVICRKMEKEIKSVSAFECLIHRYKGPSSLPMPAKEAVCKVLPLHVLVRAALPKNR